MLLYNEIHTLLAENRELASSGGSEWVLTDIADSRQLGASGRVEWKMKLYDINSSLGNSLCS